MSHRAFDVRRAAAFAAMAMLAGCGQVLDPAGPIGAGERTILFDSLAIMLCIIVPVIVLTLGFAWWYREGNTRAKYRPDFVYSGRVELVVWAIPLLTIMFLGGIAWIGSHELDPPKTIEAKAPTMEVQVVSLDWKWLFIYPGQGVASVNRVVVPVGVPVRFHITSGSVMNAFFVPRLGSMIYAMNGMETKLNLMADRPGRFMGLSTMFSGDGFPGMHFDVDAVPAARFGQWVAQAKGAGPVLDRAGYAALARQSTDEPQRTYAAVQPGLFDAIVAQAVPPAAGPDKGQGGPQVSPRPQGSI
jgi:cytochrome o ubiquinol oxidase subunit 2